MKNIIRRNRAALILVLAIAMIAAFMPVTGQSVFAATASYSDQPSGGGQGVTYNSVKMLDPDTLDTATNITVLKEYVTDDTGYSNDLICLNEIDDTIDASKTDMITFTWLMTAGMNNFNEDSFLNDSPSTGLTKNIDNIKIWKSDMSEVVAEYSEGNGDLVYVKAIKSGSGELNNQGNVKTKGIIIGVKTSCLRNGKYILQFNANLRGNNSAKTLLYNDQPCHVRFLFTVSKSPELSAMIQKAEDFLAAATIGTESGSYPQEQADKLTEAIATAKADKQTIDDSGVTGEEQEDQYGAVSGVLYDALEDFKSSRILDLSIDSITGFDNTIEVGDTSIAKSEVSVKNITGDDLAQYQKVTWSSDSDCVSINSASGKWFANYAGTAKITATSVSSPEVSKTVTIKVQNPTDVDVAVCKASKSVSIKMLVEDAIAESGKTAATIKSLRVITSPGFTLDTSDGNQDIGYIKSSLTGLETLDMKQATLDGDELPTAAFEGCTSLQKVILPDDIDSIAIGAFHNCTNLQNVDLPANITYIGGGAFAGCSSLNSTMYCYSALPPTYTQTSPAWGDAFNGTSEEQSAGFSTPVRIIYVPAGCGEDYQKASGWKNYRIKEMEPVSLNIHFTESKNFEAAAEAACTAAGVDQAHVTNLTITSPDNVYLEKTYDIAYLQSHFYGVQYLDLSGTHFDGENIQSSTFANRKNMKEIYFSDAITHFGKTAFSGCSNLRTITIPEACAEREVNTNTAAIGENCFANCAKLTEMTFDCPTWPGFDGSFPTTVKTIYVPSAMLSAYKEAQPSLADLMQPAVTVTTDETVSMEVFTSGKLTQQVTIAGKDAESARKTYDVKWEILDSDNTGDYDKGAIKLTEDGTVTGLKYGTTVARVIVGEGTINECSATCQVTVSRPEAVILKASASKYNAVRLSWTAMKNAGGYQILRSSTAAGSTGTPAADNFTLIATLSPDSMSYVDTVTTGKTYYYKVRGFKTIGDDTILGDFSAVSSAKTAPNRVTSLSVKNKSKRKAVLTWSRAYGAGYYKIYRSTKKSTGYKLIKTVKSTTRTWTNTGLKKNKRYYYKVRTYANGTYGSWSPVKYVKIRK